MAEIIGAPTADIVREWNIAHGVSEERLCPTTGEVCSYRSRIIDLFSEDVTEEDSMMLPDELQNDRNPAKMQLRLAEATAFALATNCDGSNMSEKCPTGVRIQESRLRKGFRTSWPGKVLQRFFS